MDSFLAQRQTGKRGRLSQLQGEKNVTRVGMRRARGEGRQMGKKPQSDQVPALHRQQKKEVSGYGTASRLRKLTGHQADAQKSKCKGGAEVISSRERQERRGGEVFGKK